MTLNCVVVDDSKIQRLSIIKLIENHKYLNLIAEYSSARETNKGLIKHQVDLIFLDNKMPVLTMLLLSFLILHSIYYVYLIMTFFYSITV